MENSTLKILLSNEVICDILRVITDRKKVKFKDLRDLVYGSDDVKASEHLEQALQILQDTKLIGVVDSQYRDFNSYYLTATGAQVIRQLENFGGLNVRTSNAFA